MSSDANDIFKARRKIGLVWSWCSNLGHDSQSKYVRTTVLDYILRSFVENQPLLTWSVWFRGLFVHSVKDHGKWVGRLIRTSVAHWLPWLPPTLRNVLSPFICLCHVLDIWKSPATGLDYVPPPEGVSSSFRFFFSSRKLHWLNPMTSGCPGVFCSRRRENTSLAK